MSSNLPLLHLLFEVIGYLVALALFSLRVRGGRDVVDRQSRYQLMLAAGVGAMVGTRLLAALDDPLRVLHGLAAGQFLFGKTIVGGLLGGLVAVEWMKKSIDIGVATGDPLVVPIGVGLSIGRIGCFLASSIDETEGLPSSLPWALRDVAGIARHPVALYEIAFLALLTPLALAAGKRGREGDGFKVFLSGYLLFRFLVDFLKPFPPRLYGGVSAIQLACLAGLGYYTMLFARRLRRVEATG